jgi:tetratricopeptide (TPR) repeat protein
MGYLPYYLLWIAAAWAFGYPWLLLAVVGVFLVRRWLPNPYLYFKFAGKVKRLKSEIAQNPDNVTARRDLAKIWLEKRRPRRAIPLLEEARRRDGESAELAFLLGKALARAGRSEQALEPLVQAASIDDRIYYGEAYLVAGAALERLDRFAEAEDALDRYISINSSSVEGRVRLARVRGELGNKDGRKAATADAIETFSHLPRFKRRGERGWYLRALLMSWGLA